MYWSRLFIPTLREDPAQAESEVHRLLIRAGYIRRHSQGSYNYLFAARRSLSKIEEIARQEMEAIGVQEIWLAGVDPTASLIDIARELRSYREFPQIWWYSGSMEQRSFSLDLSRDALDESYEKHAHAYRRIIERSGLEFIDSGTDFMTPSDAGGDFIVRCGNYAASLEMAAGIPAPLALPDPEGDLAPEEFHTPDIKTIAELAAFTGLPETSLAKSLVLLSLGNPVMALLRGDHKLSEAKLAQTLDSPNIGHVRPDQLRQWLGANAGSLGPVGVTTMPIIADEALRGRRNLIAGANRDDYHLRNVTPGKDFEARFADIRQVVEGDASIVDGSPLRIDKAIKLASLRKLGAGEPALQIKNAAGEDAPLLLGHYRLWIERILIATADANRDADGLMLAPSIAPFTVVIVPIDFAIEELRRASEEIYAAAKHVGFDVLLDDRNVRAGVKFKDSDLVGIPYRISIGKKLAQGMVEISERRSKQKTDVPVSEAAAFLSDRLMANAYR
jgi:prolyl-tRNA synthetase